MAFFRKSRMKNIYVMTTSLPLTYGGRTGALLQRCRLLTEFNNKVSHAILLTTNYNPDYGYIYKDYRRKGTVNDKISFENMYDCFKWSNKVGIKKNYKDYLVKEFGQGLYSLKKKETSHITFFYKNGIPLYYLSYNRKAGRIGHIDVFLNQHKHSAIRLYMNKDGNIHKIRYFKDAYEKNVVRDVFVDQEMNAYLTKEYSYKNDKLVIGKIILFQSNGHSEVFNSENELIKYWFNNIFEDEDIIINDVRALDKPLLEVEKKIKRIFQMHGPHLSDPQNVESETKRGFNYLFENIKGENDKIVSLTEAQKKDILTKYPFLKNKITVIPHCVEKKVKVKHKVNPKNICIVSRLVKLKRIDHAIIAFSNLLKEREGWILNIYGDGEEESNLKSLVCDLGIEDSVNFKGFTRDPQKAFQTAEYSIMTSLFEGFGMTVMESVVNGCPVVSYDIHWGPGEIIDEKSGVLVQSGNLEELKNAMIEIIDNPLNRDRVAETYKEYSKEVFLKKWTEII